MPRSSKSRGRWARAVRLSLVAGLATALVAIGFVAPATAAITSFATTIVSGNVRVAYAWTAPAPAAQVMVTFTSTTDTSKVWTLGLSSDTQGTSGGTVIFSGTSMLGAEGCTMCVVSVTHPEGFGAWLPNDVYQTQMYFLDATGDVSRSPTSTLATNLYTTPPTMTHGAVNGMDASTPSYVVRVDTTFPLSPRGIVSGVNYLPRWTFDGLGACSSHSLTVQATGGVSTNVVERLTVQLADPAAAVFSADFTFTATDSLRRGCAYSVTVLYMSALLRPPYPNDPYSPTWASAKLASVAIPAPPDAPAAATAVGGGMSAQVVITPGSDGLAPIANYRLRFTPPEGSPTFVDCGANTTCSTSNSLWFDTTYAVAVQAQNALGSSPWFDAGTITTDRCLVAAGQYVYWGGCYKVGVSLPSADLRGARLDGAVFSGANLAGANLSGANLAGANLVGADLTGANLEGANLTGADLTASTLTGASGTNISDDGSTRLPHGWAIYAGIIGTVPAAPTAPSHTRGDREVTLSWSASGVDALPTLSYRVRSTNFATDGAECTSAAGVNGGGSCTITGLTSGTAYTFEIVPTNAAGEGASLTTQTIPAISAPEAPQVQRVTIGDREAAVSWTASTPDGGSPITRFQVTASPGGQQCVAVDTNSCTVRELANGTTYTFTVRAMNEAGYGVASAPTAGMVPFGLPATPTGIISQPRGASVLVSWQEPSANGSAIEAYAVTTFPRSGGCVAYTTSCLISGLAPGVAYTFRVIAINEAGASLPSPRTAETVLYLAPSAPTKPTVSFRRGQAVFAWRSPAQTGGQTVTSYVLTVMPGGKKCTTASLTCAINGLRPGTRYSATVVAVNAVGAGAKSPVAPFVMR